jgi:transaldolase
MKIFIDTADIEQIKEAASWGILDGVTTNPTLVAREKRNFADLIRDIHQIVDGPISAEVVSLESAGMVEEARKLARLGRNIAVKIPLTKEGLKAAKILSRERIKTNVTLCFSPAQALLAAKAGAAFISPFIGRLDDISTDGMQLVREIKQIYANYGYKTEIIVASIRHPLHVLEAAKAGADIATIPFGVLEKLLKHPLTDIGIERFLRDWQKLSDEEKTF